MQSVQGAIAFCMHFARKVCGIKKEKKVGKSHVKCVRKFVEAKKYRHAKWCTHKNILQITMRFLQWTR